MATTQAYKPSEGKREEFRKYLEKAGIMDALTKVLVNLYEEVDKPEDALTYIIDKLALQAGLETHKTLNEKLEEATAQCTGLQDELDLLKKSEAEATEVPEGTEALPDYEVAPPEQDAAPAPPSEETPPVSDVATPAAPSEEAPPQ